jgi:phosphate transport system permease protein
MIQTIGQALGRREKNQSIRKGLDATAAKLLLLTALVSLLAVVLISLFIMAQSIPFFSEVPLRQFLFSTQWAPSANYPTYGIFSFIVTSIIVTLLALAFSTPIALSTAIYLSEFAQGKMASLLRQSIELLAGIPSIIYGLFGIAVVVPLVRNTLGGNGYSLLSASLILAIMILPTIINVSEVSIRAVSRELREASVAMGATRWQTIKGVVLPAAKSGIVSSIILGIGRAVGETTAVLLVGGNAPIFPTSAISMGRTLTMNIITDMSYAEGTHMSALFATGILLFAFILVLNLIVVSVSRKSRLESER